MVWSKVLLFARRFQAKNCISLILIGAVLLLIVGSGSHRKSEWIASSTVMRGTDNNKNADAVKRDLTPREIIEYFYWSNRSSCQLVHDFGGQMLRNPSGLDGQKAVCLDPAVRPQSGDCIVYSFGINHEWSFDEAMKKYGCHVYAFDPTDGLSNHSRNRRIHFFNLGLGDRDYVTEEGWTMRTLASIYQMLLPVHGEKVIDYLKMDIEKTEWDVLPQLISSGMLAKVRQLGVEFHLPESYETVGQYEALVNIVKSVEKAGMIRFDSKYNPWCRTKLKALDNYNGTNSFEIAFYQIFPNSNPIESVYTFD